LEALSVVELLSRTSTRGRGRGTLIKKEENKRGIVYIIIDAIFDGIQLRISGDHYQCAAFLGG
jgi:hypothetical protein